jgi:microcystin-dependent protein
MPWLTPDDQSGTVYRLLPIPVPLLGIVNGALLRMIDVWEWERFGDMSVDDCIAYSRAMLDVFWQGNIMIGTVVANVGSIVPANCLLCDGTEYTRIAYPDLYDAIAAAYKTDADHFVTPNLVDMFIMGSSANVANTGGEAEHTLTTGEIPAHSHSDIGHVHSEVTAIPSVTTVGLEPPEPTALPSVGSTGIGYANIQNTGDGEAHNNIPPYHAMTYVIIAK